MSAVISENVQFRVVILGKSQPAENRNLSRLISNLNRLKNKKTSTSTP
jgi:hypothetical protein